MKKKTEIDVKSVRSLKAQEVIGITYVSVILE